MANSAAAAERGRPPPGPERRYTLAQLATLDCLSSPVWAFDIERTAMRYANAEAVRIWGAASQADLRARDMSGLSAPARQRLEAYLEGFRRGRPVDEQWTFYPKGVATTVRCRCSGLLLDEEDGGAGRTVMLVEGLVLAADASDCEARRNIEALRHTPAQITLFSVTGEVLMQNPAAAGSFGLPPPGPAFAGRLVDEGAGERVRARLAAGEVLSEAHRVRTREGERWHWLDARRTLDPVTSQAAILCSQSDITERVAARAALRLRTEELHAALEAQAEESRQKGLLLANINDGLVMLDRAGYMSQERSAATTAWFGPHRDGVTFWDYVFPFDPAASAGLRQGFQALADDFMPVELTLAQLPAALRVGERTLRVDYKPISAPGPDAPAAGPPDGVMLVIHDTTSEVHRERLEAEQRELMEATDRLLRNRDGFRDFLLDADQQVGALLGERWRQQPLAEVRRMVHTLKGNTAVYGLRSISGFCHEVETRMAEVGGGPAAADLEELGRRWRSLHGRFAPLLDRPDRDRLEIGREEYAALLQGLEAAAAPAQLLAMARGWQLQSTESKLVHLAEGARELCRRLGKGEAEVTVRAAGVRISAARFAPFFGVLSHVVRNAIDHGLEPPEEREARGKPAAPRLRLSTHLSGKVLVVEVEDDGRGIDWARLGERARAAGLPAEDREALARALFHDGVSTRDEVTEISGRGVGLSAVAAACADLGGEIAVTSEPGQGTTFRFSRPASPGAASAPPRAGSQSPKSR